MSLFIKEEKDGITYECRFYHLRRPEWRKFKPDLTPLQELLDCKKVDDKPTLKAKFELYRREKHLYGTECLLRVMDSEDHILAEKHSTVHALVGVDQPNRKDGRFYSFMKALTELPNTYTNTMKSLFVSVEGGKYKPMALMMKIVDYLKQAK